MASNKLKKFKDHALLLANDLRTGLTVYMTSENTWSTERTDALRLDNSADAERLLGVATESVRRNVVVDPYLVDATENSSPTHIRERIRVDGPTINYRQNQTTT